MNSTKQTNGGKPRGKLTQKRKAKIKKSINQVEIFAWETCADEVGCLKEDDPSAMEMLAAFSKHKLLEVGFGFCGETDNFDKVIFCDLLQPEDTYTLDLRGFKFRKGNTILDCGAADLVEYWIDRPSVMDRELGELALHLKEI